MNRCLAGRTALLAALLALSCQGRVRGAADRDLGPEAPAQATPPVPAVDAEPAPAPSPGPAPASVVTPASAELPQEPPVAPPPAEAAVRPAPLWKVKARATKCVRAPCPSLSAVPVDGAGEALAVAELDLAGLGLSAKDTQRLRAAVYREGLLVRGELESRTDKRGVRYQVLRATALPSR